MSHATRRATRAPLGALGVGAALIIGTAACSGSPSPPTPAPPSTTTTAPTTTTTNATAVQLASEADQLCAQVGAALSDVKHLSLSAPSGLTSAPKTVSGDIQRLEGIVTGLQRAGTASGHTSQISGVVQAFQRSIAAGKGVLTEVAAANFGLAERDLRAFGTHLTTAVRRIDATNLAHCSTGAATTTTG
ncbi:MAG: hypothetical protein ACRD0L_12015 [Acidimicrobiales bacterium]